MPHLRGVKDIIFMSVNVVHVTIVSQKEFPLREQFFSGHISEFPKLSRAHGEVAIPYLYTSSHIVQLWLQLYNQLYL